jgi:hypothetical protein
MSALKSTSEQIRLPDLLEKYVPTSGDFYPNSFLPRPENIRQIIVIAEKIDHGFNQLQVGLHSTASGIYFGETSYCGGSGLTPWLSGAVDRELGRQWILPAPVKQAQLC